MTQSAQIDALREQVSDLKSMVSMMQELIINQNKQITEIHKALFNHPKKTKQEIREDDKASLKARIMTREIAKR